MADAVRGSVAGVGDDGRPDGLVLLTSVTLGAFGTAAVAIAVLTLWRWTAARYRPGRTGPGGQ